MVLERWQLFLLIFHWPKAPLIFIRQNGKNRRMGHDKGNLIHILNKLNRVENIHVAKAHVAYLGNFPNDAKFSRFEPPDNGFAVKIIILLKWRSGVGKADAVFEYFVLGVQFLSSGYEFAVAGGGDLSSNSSILRFISRF